MADRIFLVFGPSGSGKTSIVTEALKKSPNLTKPITYTTRQMRAGEQHGRDYFFLSKDEFDLDRKSFTETSEYHGNYYGSKANDIWDYLYQGKDVIMILDINGIWAYVDWAYDTQIIEPKVIFIQAKDPVGQIMERAAETGETIEQISERIALMEAEAALANDPVVDVIIENNPGDMSAAVDKLLDFVGLQKV